MDTLPRKCSAICSRYVTFDLCPEGCEGALGEILVNDISSEAEKTNEERTQDLVNFYSMSSAVEQRRRRHDAPGTRFGQFMAR